jgi:hypothetical protein
MEEDLILGDESDEVEEGFEYETIEGYTYTEYISAACEVLNTIQSGDFMTQDDIRRAKEMRTMSIEMLHFCVKKMHQMLFIDDIVV